MKVGESFHDPDKLPLLLRAWHLIYALGERVKKTKDTWRERFVYTTNKYLNRVDDWRDFTLASLSSLLLKRISANNKSEQFTSQTMQDILLLVALFAKFPSLLEDFVMTLS